MPVDTTFLDELASSAPTPGGGGAAAYAGALAAALASMVGNLTTGKARYAEYEDQTQAELANLEQYRTHLLELIDADAEAFKPLAATYSMPRETPEQQQAREAAMQAALTGACDAPLEIMRTCTQVMESCIFFAEHGSRLALSDAGAAAVLAKAALLTASLNLYINVGSMTDPALADHYRHEANALIIRGNHLTKAAYNQVAQELDAPWLEHE